jgi:hypothetical protein
MNTNKYDLKEKEIRALEKRQRELWKAIKEQPYLELKEPFQRGWEVYYKLRDDITRRRDIDGIRELFGLAYEECRETRSAHEIKLVRRGERGYYMTYWDGERRYVSLGPKRKFIDQWQYDQLEDRIKRWYVLDHYKSSRSCQKQYRIDIPDYWLVMKVRAHIVTHQQMIDGDLYSESDLIKRKLEMLKSRGWRRKNYDPIGRKRVEVRAAIQKFMKGITEDVEIGRANPPHW